MLFKNTISPADIFTSLDWIVFTVIALITIGAVIYGNSLKKNANEKESFLDLLIMGRQLTMPMFVATLVATFYGGIMGVTKIAFESGVYNFITQGVFWYISYVLFAFFIVHKIKGYEAITLPDLIGKMFGPKSERLSAVFNIFNVLPIVYTISLGLILQSFFGTNFELSMFIGLSIVLFYSMFGGFRAVVFSDMVQFAVMILGVFLVFVFSINYFGGIEFLENNLPATHFDPTGGHSLATTFVWGFIALSTLVDPNFYQRCFAAKDERTAQKGILISTCVWIGFDICTTAGAMYARAVIPEADSSSAYLTYAIQLLPSGMRGFFLAGIVATIISTLDSYLFLAGTTLTFDLGPKKWKESRWFHHIGLIFVGLCTFLMAIVFDGNIKTVWKTLGSYSASCLLLPVLIGYIFPKRITDNQFVGICLLGVVATTYWRNATHTGLWGNIDELYVGIIATGMGILFSLVKNKKNVS